MNKDRKNRIDELNLTVEELISLVNNHPNLYGKFTTIPRLRSFFYEQEYHMGFNAYKPTKEFFQDVISKLSDYGNNLGTAADQTTLAWVMSGLIPQHKATQDLLNLVDQKQYI